MAAKVVLLLRKGQFAPSVSVNAAMTLVILFSLKTMESLQNGVATDFQVTPLFSMSAMQSCRRVVRVDADA